MSLNHPRLLPDDAPFDDPDNPEWTEEDFARAKGPDSLPPEILAAFPKTLAKLRGLQMAPTKTQVALRLDADIVAHFKAGGRGWHSRINAALKALIAKEKADDAQDALNQSSPRLEKASR